MEGLLSGRVCAIAVKLRVVKNCFVLFRLTPNEASCWRRRTRGWKTTQMSEFETARRSRGCRTTSSSSATASRWCSQSSWQKENIRTTLAVSGTTYLLLLCRNRPVHPCITFYQPPGASGYCFARHHAVAVCLWVCLSVLKSFLTVTPLQVARFASTVHIKPYQQGHQRMGYVIWKGYVRFGIISVKKLRYNSWHQSSWFLALTTAIPCSPAFLRVHWRLCSLQRVQNEAA